MEERRELTEAERLEEERFIESFAYAMKEAAKKIDGAREGKLKELGIGALRAARGNIFRRSAIDVLTEAGNWNARYVAEQYVLITEKKSALPRSLRTFIVALGAIARDWHFRHCVEQDKQGQEKAEQSCQA